MHTKFPNIHTPKQGRIWGFLGPLQKYPAPKYEVAQKNVVACQSYGFLDVFWVDMHST